MKTHNLRLHVLAALMASASVFHVGCGDDDDNATPSNTGGKGSTTGGTSTTTGGRTTGGTSTTTGGTSTTTGGTAGEGSGGEPTTMGGTAGAAGTAGMPTEGGSAGAGGGGGSPEPGLPPCTSSDLKAGCYAECEPVTSATSEQFLNHCSDAGANCTKFDNSTLTKLGANGALPPLP